MQATPFIIEIKNKNIQIEVLGTQFNVTAYNDEPVIKTSLFKGKITIRAGDKTAMLSPMQEAQINGTALTIVDMNANSFASAKAWKDGNFNFEGDLPFILRQIGRWYDIEIVIRSKQPGTANYGGSLSRHTSMHDLLKILTLNNIQYRLEGRTLIL